MQEWRMMILHTAWIAQKKTVERIRKGEHVLQIRGKLAKAETITHNPEQKNEDVFIGAILANQREIIGLLDELASVWRG